jgi:alcohol dehydrogenase (NADP+)
VREERLTENMELFRLSDEHMARISHIAEVKGTVRYLDPRNHIGFNIFNESADEPVESAGSSD